MTRLGPIRCVVFDIDDTLYLERDYVRSGFVAVADFVRDTLGLPDFAGRAWRAFENGQRQTIFDHVLGQAGVPFTAALVQQLVQRYRAHEPDIALLPDARRCLDALAVRGLRLAAVSDGPLLSQQAKVRALGLAAWLDPIVLTAALGPGLAKPHPRPFRQVEAATGHAGPACVYVADNPTKDFAGPRTCGWRTVRVRRAGGLHAAAPSDAHVEVELPDLEAFLERLGDAP